MMHEALTEREIDMLIGLAKGQTNEAIGKELFISIPTVKFHMRNLYRKLNARNGPHAVALGYQHGILQQLRLF